MARDIQKLLDYSERRNFLLVIDKAKIACMNSGQNTGVAGRTYCIGGKNTRARKAR